MYYLILKEDFRFMIIDLGDDYEAKEEEVWEKYKGRIIDEGKSISSIANFLYLKVEVAEEAGVIPFIPDPK